MGLTHMLYVEEVGRSVLASERNCEDAVNVIAYEAYCRRHGDTPMHELDMEEIDGFLEAAREFVRKKGKWYGIEWEEF